jgi:hypothetical protein
MSGMRYRNIHDKVPTNHANQIGQGTPTSRSRDSGINSSKKYDCDSSAASVGTTLPSCDSWRATCLAFLFGEKTGLAKGDEAEEAYEAEEAAAEGSAGCVRAELPAAAIDADSGLSELRLNQFRNRRRLDGGGEGARLACDDAASEATPAIIDEAVVGVLVAEDAANVRDAGTADMGAGAGGNCGACMSKSCGDAVDACCEAGAFTTVVD